MAKLTLNSTSTGSVSFDAPVTTENTIITVPAANAGMQVMRLETAKTATGTSVDFTDIPSWVKKITVMFNGVSTNGTSQQLLQLGTAAGFETTGYISHISVTGQTMNYLSTTTGFGVYSNGVADTRYGTITFINIATNVWVSSHSVGYTSTSTGYSYSSQGGGSKTLSGVLDKIRITTVNGTDTFDAGTINIMYE